MVDKVSIWNMALVRIGSSGFIQSPDERTAEANHCRVVYDNSVIATLEAMDWSFARRTIALADLGTPEDDWNFQYAYPANCVKVRRIKTAMRNEKPPPYKVGLNSTGTQKVINTDVEGAKIICTSKVTNEAFFTAGFAEALSWKIGIEIAPPLTGNDAKTLNNVNTGFYNALAIATATDMNEGQQDEPEDASWIKEYN